MVASRIRVRWTPGFNFGQTVQVVQTVKNVGTGLDPGPRRSDSLMSAWISFLLPRLALLG